MIIRCSLYHFSLWTLSLVGALGFSGFTFSLATPVVFFPAAASCRYLLAGLIQTASLFPPGKAALPPVGALRVLAAVRRRTRLPAHAGLRTARVSVCECMRRAPRSPAARLPVRPSAQGS